MELLIGILIASLACLTIIYSTLYYQGRLYDIKLRERAYEELKGYTDFWKGKIAAKNFGESGFPDTKTACLFEEENNTCTHSAILRSQITYVEVDPSNAHRRILETSIEWNSRTNVSREINFYLEQLILKKISQNTTP